MVYKRLSTSFFYKSSCSICHFKIPWVRDLLHATQSAFWFVSSFFFCHFTIPHFPKFISILSKLNQKKPVLLLNRFLIYLLKKFNHDSSQLLQMATVWLIAKWNDLCFHSFFRKRRNRTHCMNRIGILWDFI